MPTHGNRNIASNNPSISENSSNFDNKLNKKRKFNLYIEDYENSDKDKQILNKIRQKDKSIFVINKDGKSEVSDNDNFKDTVVRFKNRKIFLLNYKNNYFKAIKFEEEMIKQNQYHNEENDVAKNATKILCKILYDKKVHITDLFLIEKILIYSFISK